MSGTILADNFAGAAGTNLEAHASDSGAPYVIAAGAGPIKLDGGGRAYSANANNPAYRTPVALATGPSAYPITVAFGVKVLSLDDSYVGISLHQDPSSNASIYARVIVAGGVIYPQIMVSGAGNDQFIGGGVGAGWGVGEYDLTLTETMAGEYVLSGAPAGQAQAQIGNVGYDNAQVEGGYVGVRAGGSSGPTGGILLEGYSVVGVALAPPTVPGLARMLRRFGYGPTN